MSGQQDTPPPPPSEYQKQQWKEAERVHDKIDEGSKVHADAVEAFGVLTIRSLSVTAAGGIAATLGFYTANYVRIEHIPGALHEVNIILGGLFFSLILSLLASGAGYFSQIAYAAVNASIKRTYTYPYRESTPKTATYLGVGDIFRWSAIIFAFGSAAALITCGVRFLGLVS